ncbi:phosphotransferase system sugar-specific permease component [Lucifera butyrica]|uniref:Phosphotransferase system sugar-specific permease component n=1 Tax=Lucifera butyrica TaxID=1351585 RepID=A0A498REF6_9FIRM|nr:PTS transporter subunit IIC [Lucifera butyrica]VBB07568.1 phosphotransferase system sugar-specific permease component [Lucifera butyrica]
MGIIKFILDLGPTVMMPVIITVLGLIFRQTFAKAFRAGITIGIGFAGISLVIGLLVSNLSPATQAMVKNWGLHLDVMDVGWPISAAISFGTTIVPAVFLVGFAINIIMLALNWTKTMDVDLWNYWHFIFTGALVMYLTNSTILGIIAAGITIIIIFKLADWTSPYVSEFFEIPGVSLPHTETVSWAPVGIFLNKIIDKIPGINRIELNPEKIQQRFGLIGEPMLIGLVMGAFMGLLAKYDLKGILQLAVNLAAVLFLMPRMVRILMEGLLPLSESAREFINKRFPGKEVLIGLDAAIVIGHPSVISTALLLIPITLFLATVLPYNRILPFADLAVLPFLMIWAVAPSRGNVFRGVIIGTVFMMAILFIGTDIANVSTLMAKGVNFPFPEGTSSISSLDGGAHLVPYILFKLVQLFY